MLCLAISKKLRHYSDLTGEFVGMPKGPKGEKRPGDVVGAAVMVARIATGEIEEKTENGKNPAAVALGRMGGKARAEKLSKKRRSEIAKKAAASRWNKK